MNAARRTAECTTSPGRGSAGHAMRAAAAPAPRAPRRMRERERESIWRTTKEREGRTASLEREHSEHKVGGRCTCSTRRSGRLQVSGAAAP
eukprot:2022810-Prymnesium_polylepis.1